jgi:hypothetical protein
MVRSVPSELFLDPVPGYVQRGVLRFNRRPVLPGGLDAWAEGFRLPGRVLLVSPHENELSRKNLTGNDVIWVEFLF